MQKRSLFKYVLFVFVIFNLYYINSDTNKLKSDIFILNSYHPGNSFSDLEISGLKSVLLENTEYFIEYMDAKRISGNERYLMDLIDIYKIKYFGMKFDLIVSMDDDALRFLLKYNDMLFPDTPVVFCGVNSFYDTMLEGKTLFTGVAEVIDIKATVDLALKLQPDIKEIFFINDNTTSGKINRSNFEKIIKSSNYNVDFIFLTPETGITFEDLKAKIRQLPEKSVLNFLNFYQDKTGKIFSPEEIIPEIVKNSPVPLYTQSGDLIGHGLVGGYVNSGFYQGEAAGKIALRILSGERVQI